MEFVLILFLVGFLLGTFWLHIEFWINTIGLEYDGKIMIATLFTFPLFPIFGMIELIRRIPFKIKIERK
jgi:hypothetical protein